MHSHNLFAMSMCLSCQNQNSYFGSVLDGAVLFHLKISRIRTGEAVGVTEFLATTKMNTAG